MVIEVLLLIALVAAVVVFRLPRGEKPALDPVKFRPFELVEKRQLNANTAIYRFALPTKTSRLGLLPGQHLSVQATINGKQLVRSYTPVSSTSTTGHFDLLVKSYPNGNVSKYFAELRIGDKVLMRGPKGEFDYKPNTHEHLSMVAGGSGVTPMLQLLQAIVEDPEDRTSATLLFANVKEPDIVLREELAELVSKKPDQIKVLYTLDNPGESWKGHAGRVDGEKLSTLFPQPNERSKLLLCGPMGMTNAVKKEAAKLGWEMAKQPSRMNHQVFIF